MLSLVSLDQREVPHRPSSPPISNDCYMIVLKRVVSGDLTYGRTRVDFSNGALLFFAPRQVLEWQEVEVEQQGFMLNIHEDYLRGTVLAEKVKSYGYFSYTVNEALHLSPREEKTIDSLYGNIGIEYLNNQDEHSKEIIVSLVETLLKYSERFYRRQFLHRKDLTSDLSFQFQQAMQGYFETRKPEELGAPTIGWIADELALSTRYLSDALKVETGKTAMEHLHLNLIDRAKNLLLERDSTVAEVAYQLGFEYPQYFSRLFKKKVGVSPTAFRDGRALN